MPNRPLLTSPPKEEITLMFRRIWPTPTLTFASTARNPFVPLKLASQPGASTVITQGSVVLTDGCSVTFGSSCVPAHPATIETKKLPIRPSFKRRFIPVTAWTNSNNKFCASRTRTLFTVKDAQRELALSLVAVVQRFFGTSSQLLLGRENPQGHRLLSAECQKPASRVCAVEREPEDWNFWESCVWSGANLR